MELGGEFEAELRGLSDRLNQPQGRYYQKHCSAVLGDAKCGVDLTAPGAFADVPVQASVDARVFTFAPVAGFADGWFERGRLAVQDGAGAGLLGLIKSDRTVDGSRVVELWQSLRAEIVPGDTVRLEPGCDKRPETCAQKFDNFLNFRGFPHIPGEDWLSAYPRKSGSNDGMSAYAVPENDLELE